jgi:hypothetical protein
MQHGEVPGAKPRGHDPGSIKVLGVQYFGHAERGWQSDVGYTDDEGALDYCTYA